MRSRFAVKEDIFSDEFSALNRELLELNKEYQLVDHRELNRRRFNWTGKFENFPVFYGSRFWEYPFAILSAELKHGMSCADIGCGTTPFTPFLCRAVGEKNVTGFDPDLLNDNESKQHFAFGIKKDFIQRAGFNFFSNDMTRIQSPDESFDRVFCISVIEHIEEPSTWQKGIREMARILKPGGRLIMTVDLGINNPLTNPLALIQHSGLTPAGTIDLRWPEERFVNLNGEGMDVFGLVLEKSSRNIFLDTEKKQVIREFEANKKFTPPITSGASLQVAKDFERPNGALRVIAKIVSGKYS